MMRIKMYLYIPHKPNAIVRRRETVVNAAGQRSLRPFHSVECSQCHSERLYNITNIRSQIHENTMRSVLQHVCVYLPFTIFNCSTSHVPREPGLQSVLSASVL